MKKYIQILIAYLGVMLFIITACSKNYGLKVDNGYTTNQFPDTISAEVDTSVKIDKSKYIQASVFPGLISPDEPRLKDFVVDINLSYIDVPSKDLRISVAPGNWISTGMWAPAGELITIEVPDGIYGLQAQIGSHTDNLSGKTELKRDPLIYNRKQLFPGKNYLRNLYGGLVYILPSAPTGNIVPVKFTGTAKSASFFIGKTTDAEWNALVQSSTVPFFELVGRRIVFTLEKAKLAQAPIASPSALVELWDNTIKATFWDWYGLIEGNPDVKNRAPFNQWRVVHDIQPGAGAQHSGFPVVALNTMNYFRQAVTVDLVKGSNWGTYHELGHNMQMGSTWSFGGNGEVTNNLFSFKNALNNGRRHNNELRSWNAAIPYVSLDTLAKRWDGTTSWEGSTVTVTNPTDDAKMSFYTQIFEKYGYDFMTYLATAARNARFTSIDGQSKVDFYYERLSEFTKTDMYRFMREWGLTVSNTSRRAIALKGYPLLKTNLWMYNPYTKTGGDQTILPKIEFGNGNPGSIGWVVESITNTRSPLSTYGPDKMLDGNTGSIWSSCFQGCAQGPNSGGNTPASAYPFSLVAKTGSSPVTAAGFYFIQRQNTPSTHITSIKIEVSSDKLTWEDVGTYTLQTGTSAYGKQYLELSEPKTFQYFRFTWGRTTDGNNNSAIAEIGAYRY